MSLKTPSSRSRLIRVLGVDTSDNYQVGLLDQLLGSDFLSAALSALDDGWLKPAQVSPATAERRIRRFQTFARWAENHGRRALPADSDTVALYATEKLDSGVTFGTVKEDLNAIDWYHAREDLPAPGEFPEIQEFRRGAFRTAAKPPKQAYPIATSDLEKIVGAIEGGALDFGQANDGRNSLRRLRAKALFLVTFSSGGRITDVLLAQASWLSVRGHECVALEVPRSKNHPDGVRYEFYEAVNASLCPVRALGAWLSAAVELGLPGNLLFPQVKAKGTRPVVDPFAGLTGIELAKKVDDFISREGELLKRAAAAGGVEWDPRRQGLATRSLRRGLATEAYQAGAAIHEIQRTLGHVRVQTTSRYVDVEPLKGMEGVFD